MIKRAGFVIAGALFLIAGPVQAQGRTCRAEDVVGPVCNMSACIPRLHPRAPVAFVAGPCPDEAQLDFAGARRQLRFRDGSLGCAAGAWGFRVKDPETDGMVAVNDCPVSCTEVLRLCPWVLELAPDELPPGFPPETRPTAPLLSTESP